MWTEQKLNIPLTLQHKGSSRFIDVVGSHQNISPETYTNKSEIKLYRFTNSVIPEAKTGILVLDFPVFTPKDEEKSHKVVKEKLLEK